jgi:hypothetical protein
MLQLPVRLPVLASVALRFSSLRRGLSALPGFVACAGAQVLGVNTWRSIALRPANIPHRSTLRLRPSVQVPGNQFCAPLPAPSVRPGLPLLDLCVEALVLWLAYWQERLHGSRS